MIYAKSDLYGIDSKINLIQRVLEKRLSLKWGDLEIYGVIQETIKNSNLIPEVYTDNNEYKELYLDDTKAAQICFRVLSRSIENYNHTAQVDIIFNINLMMVHGNSNRESEKAFLEAFNIIQQHGYVSEITGIKEGITDVYSGLYTGQLINKDMQPFYIFALTCNINYSTSLC